MIVVRVELWSAVSGERKELARMHIANAGDGSATIGNYEGFSYVGRDARALDRCTVSKRGTVRNYPRQRLHVWNLVTRMLRDMGYVQ